MKKIYSLLGLLFLVIIMSGCESKNEINLENKGSFEFSDVSIQPLSATIKEDEVLEVNFEWSFGYDEDSSSQENFASTGILFYAKQNGKDLEQINMEDSNIYNKIYETSKGNLYPSFKLKNKSDSIHLTLQKEGNTNQSETIKITLP